MTEPVTVTTTPHRGLWVRWRAYAWMTAENAETARRFGGPFSDKRVLISWKARTKQRATKKAMREIDAFVAFDRKITEKWQRKIDLTENLDYTPNTESNS